MFIEKLFFFFYLNGLLNSNKTYQILYMPSSKSLPMGGRVYLTRLEHMAGFFHDKPDYSDETWSKFCDRVCHGDAWLTEDGFYSCSGHGDGGYGVYAYEKDGEITALEIRFL